MKMNEEEIYVVKEINGDLCLEKWKKKGRPLMKCGHTANAHTTIPNNDNTGELKIH